MPAQALRPSTVMVKVATVAIFLMAFMVFSLGLFQTDVVVDFFHAVDVACHVDGFVDVVLGGDEAAQLDLALIGFNVDLGNLQRRFVEDGRFHLGGEGGVVDILAGALVGGRFGAADDRGQQQCRDYGWDEFITVHFSGSCKRRDALFVATPCTDSTRVRKPEKKFCSPTHTVVKSCVGAQEGEAALSAAQAVRRLSMRRFWPAAPCPAAAPPAWCGRWPAARRSRCRGRRWW